VQIGKVSWESGRDGNFGKVKYVRRE
jgi:hypothetical protein